MKKGHLVNVGKTNPIQTQFKPNFDFTADNAVYAEKKKYLCKWLFNKEIRFLSYFSACFANSAVNEKQTQTKPITPGTGPGNFYLPLNALR